MNSKRYTKQLLLCIILCISPSLLMAKPVFTINEFNKKISIGQGVEFLEDIDGSLTLDNIKQNRPSDLWKINKQNVINFSFTESSFWLRFVIKNPYDTEKRRIFEIGFPPIDYIDFYLVEGNRVVKTIKTGDRRPFKTREISHRNFLFKLSLKKKSQTTVYIKIKSHDGLHEAVPIILWSHDDFTAYDMTINMIYGVMLGFLFIMIMYNLIVYVSVREQTYLLYVLFITGISIWFFSFTGYSYKFLWSNNPWFANSILPISSCFFAIGGIVFAQKFLDTAKIIPIIHKMLSIMVLLLGILLILPFFIPYSLIYKILTPLTIITVILLFIVCIIGIIKKKRQAYFYLMTFSILMLGVTVYILKIANILPSNIITENIMLLGSSFSVIFLSLGLADQINVMKNQLINFNYDLERKVEVRTEELEFERNKLEVRNDIMEKDLSLARKIQDRLIPDREPVSYITSRYRPMDKVGGDFYDYISFPDTNKTGIFLSDVSGHGVPAAFITSMIKTILLQAGDKLQDPAELISHMNDVLLNHTADNFVTAFYGIYTPEDRSLVYANAGHFQPYIINKQSVWQLEKGDNTVIGAFEKSVLAKVEKKYSNIAVSLKPQSKMLLYTDGLIEARSAKDGTFFEDGNMKDVFMKNHSLNPDAFLDAILAELNSFTKNQSFEDDICLICVDVE